MMVRCVVVDDHPIFREGLARMLDALPDVNVVGAGSPAADAVDLAADQRPDVLLLDLHLPDRSGIDVIPDITHVSPCTHVLIVTGFADEDVMVEAYKAGARGVLYKESDVDRIAEEVRIIATGGVHLDPQIGARIVNELQRATRTEPVLTTRETQILALLTQGLSNCEIAAALGIQENTVKSHLSRLFEKVGVTDRFQAALYGIRHGLQAPDAPEWRGH